MFFIGNTGKPDCEKDFAEIINVNKYEKTIDEIFIIACYRLCMKRKFTKFISKLLSLMRQVNISSERLACAAYK
jgi:hypothetical protein